MSTQKRLFTAMTPSFCSLTDTKQYLQYTIKTHLSGPPMPKYEANMNYIPPSPSSSIKQCNKSATVKFHMELLLTTTTWKQSRSGATPSPVESEMLRVVSLITRGITEITRFNPFPNKPYFFTCLQYMSFENTAGKGEIASNDQFLLFQQCFLPA